MHSTAIVTNDSSKDDDDDDNDNNDEGVWFIYYDEGVFMWFISGSHECSECVVKLFANEQSVFHCLLLNIIIRYMWHVPSKRGRKQTTTNYFHEQ